jgi:NADPH-dependent ferric siderophore reductase
MADEKTMKIKITQKAQTKQKLHQIDPAQCTHTHRNALAMAHYPEKNICFGHFVWIVCPRAETKIERKTFESEIKN